MSDELDELRRKYSGVGYFDINLEKMRKGTFLREGTAWTAATDSGDPNDKPDWMKNEDGTIPGISSETDMKLFCKSFPNTPFC